MTSPGKYPTLPLLRTSNIQPFRPGDLIGNFDHRRSSIAAPSLLLPDTTVIQDSFLGSDDFYKSQVIERTIGGEPVYLNAMNNYKPLSGADDRNVMDQIRQEHVKIMDQKLNQAIQTNGNNAYQQVKTIIVEPIAEIIQLNVSNVQSNYNGIRKSSIANNTTRMSNHSNRISNVTVSPMLSPRTHGRTSQVGHSRLQYVPFQRKVTEMQMVQKVELIPHERTIIQYQQRRTYQQMPVQKSVLDYYAVEHVTQYQPQVTEQKVIEMVPIQRTIQTVNYVPIEQQLIHMPQSRQNSLVSKGLPTDRRQSLIKNVSPIRRSSSILTLEKPSFGSIGTIDNNFARSRSGILSQEFYNNTGQVIRTTSPVRGRNQHMYQQNIQYVNNRQIQYQKVYEQPVTYVHNISHILPLTSQPKAVRTVQQPLYRGNHHAQYPSSNNYSPPVYFQRQYHAPSNIQPIQSYVSHVDKSIFPRHQQVFFEDRRVIGANYGPGYTR